jgi:hypothetical protein
MVILVALSVVSVTWMSIQDGSWLYRPVSRLWIYRERPPWSEEEEEKT